MRITQQFSKLDDMCGWMYKLNKGEGIPMHAHKEEQYHHNTVVLKGSVAAYGTDWKKIGHEDDTLDYNSSEPHEICALEDDTIIVNVFTNGLPDNWQQMLDEGKREVEVNDLFGFQGDK